MATERRPSIAKAGNQSSEKKKQLLVVLLAFGLLGVLGSQHMTSEDEVAIDAPVSSTVAQTTESPQPVPVANPAITRPILKQDFVTIELPSRPLEDILSEPPLLVIKTKANVEMPTIEAEPPIVRAIYGSNDKSIAIVDDKIIRAGGVLPDGRRLVGAGPSGLKLRGRSRLSTSHPASIE